MKTFVSIAYSPWSEKARFALRHHGVRCLEQQYQPMLGELPLRLRLRQARGKVTVPVFFDGDTILRDSLSIARHVDAGGAGETLFPAAHLADILAWNERSEAALADGRLRTVDKTRASRDAQIEALKGVVPGPLRAPLIGIAGLGMAFLERKYGDAPRGEALEAALEALSAALAGGGRYLLGDGLTYADVAMAAVLQFVEPVDERFIRLGPATREAWRDEALAQRYAPLVAWRDALYAQHRRARPPKDLV